MKKNYLVIALILLSGCSSLNGVKKSHLLKESKLKLSDDVIPTRYDLTLWTSLSDSFSGQVAIDVELKKDTESIYLHGQDLKFSFADLTGPNESFKGQVVKVDDHGLLRIDFDRKILKGQYQLQINYSGKYQEDLSGLFRVKDGDDFYLFTQFEPLDARKMLPCFDEPRWKTPFSVKVVSNKGQVVVGNSAVVSSYTQGDQEVHIFEQTLPISTYLLALAVGPFDVVESEIDANQYRPEKIKLRGIATKGKGKKLGLVLKETPAILNKLEEYFGVAYPYGKLDLIAVPDFGAGAMENVGAITFREQRILVDNHTPAEQMRKFYLTLAHELAHQWFGNLVTMAWWDDLWLNESFATWLSHKIIDELKPEYRANEYLLHDAQVAMHQDSLKAARKIREPINENHDIHNAFDGITYKKGGAVLNMLENYLSPKLFRDAVFAHMKKFRFGTATAKDFLESLAQKSDPSLVKSAESFLNQNGFPVVNVSFRCEAKGFVIKAEQQRYRPIGSLAEEDRMWRIPLCLGYGSKTGVTKHCFTMSKKVREQEIRAEKCPDFIVPNYNGQGYYRFSMDVIDWQNLIKDAHTLKNGDRMAIADSLVGELYAGRLDFEFVLKGLKNLIDINSSAVTSYFMKVFKEADHYWMSDESRSRFQAEALKAIKPIYEQLKDKSDLSIDQRLLRKSTTRFLAEVLKDPEVRAALSPKGKTYLESLLKDKKPNQDPLVEDYLDDCLSVAMQENPQYLSKVSEKLKHMNDSSIRTPVLAAASRSQEGSDGLLVRSLVFGDLRKNELLNLFNNHLDNLKNQPSTFQFFKDNFEKLKNVFLSNQLGETPSLAEGLCSHEDALMVEQFFSPVIATFQGGPRNLLEVVEKINLCAALKKRHQQGYEKIVSTEN